MCEVYCFRDNISKYGNIKWNQCSSSICLLYISDGKFGAYMQVHIQNDGPVTIPLDSPDNLPDHKKKKTATVAPSVQSLSINPTVGDNSES